MLTVLHEMLKHYDPETQTFVASFKVIYIAPMKALVQEMVGNFTNRLKHYNMEVGELTGDSQMKFPRHVATPEKWDVITRKQTDTTMSTDPWSRPLSRGRSGGWNKRENMSSWLVYLRRCQIIRMLRPSYAWNLPKACSISMHPFDHVVCSSSS